MSDKTTSTTSVDLTTGLLGVSFVVLKLTGVINWSWWWVTAPFWAGLAIIAAMAATGLTILAGAALFGWVKSRNT